MFSLIQRRTITKSNLKGGARKWMDRHINDPYVKQAKMVSEPSLLDMC